MVHDLSSDLTGFLPEFAQHWLFPATPSGGGFNLWFYPIPTKSHPQSGAKPQASRQAAYWAQLKPV